MRQIGRRFKEKMKEARKNPGTKTLLFWRIFLSWLFAYTLNILLREKLEYLIVMWLIVVITSFIFIDKSNMKKIFVFIMSDKFDRYFNLYYRCFMSVAAAMVFSTLVVVTLVYRASPDTPVSLIGISFSVGYSLLLYAIRHFKIVHIPFCERKEINHE